MFKVWCEYDICQEGLVFKTEKAANKWLNENSIIAEIAEIADGLDGEEAVQYLKDKRLLFVVPLNAV